ncbi:MAG: DUF928 domain-containing protein [Acidobacteria bacterium]|nr:DUF928 domain-containing protein [Acidobacteriota bacterium]
MKAIKRAAVISLSALMLVIPASHGGSEEKREAPQPQPGEAQAKAPAATVAAPVYKPPLRGAPYGRVGGGTRGSEREVFVLSVLAPDHSGLTVTEQPFLYWFISSVTSSPVELTVMDPRATQPVLETRIAPPVQPGVHRIRLADHGVRLSPGVPYRWFVAVVLDSGRRSRDVLAGGAIERVGLPEGLKAKLAQAGKGEMPFLYAEAGLWYDALAAISQLIEAAPQDPMLRRQRASLLAQVGLPEIGE